MMQNYPEHVSVHKPALIWIVPAAVVKRLRTLTRHAQRYHRRYVHLGVGCEK